jgi:beta-glucanase (GH16 family)
MKTSTWLNFLLVSALLLSFSSCKKLPSSHPTSTGYVSTNPVTASTIFDYQFNDTALTDKGWKKTFEDDFDGDLSQWKVWNGGGFQNELQCFESSNAQIVDGALQLTAKQETVTGPAGINDNTPKTFNFTSGGIQCKTGISANASTPKVRIVCRVKIAKGYGMGTFIWSYGNNWPTQGAIDYVLSRGDETNVYHTDYSYGPTIGQNIVANSIEFNPTDADLSIGYHVYEMEWTKDVLTSYLDGKLVEAKTGNHIPDLFGKTEFVTLYLSVGGLVYTDLNLADIQTGTIYVDYVKVFTSN